MTVRRKTARAMMLGASSALALSFGLAAGADEAAAEDKTFNIPGQELSGALAEFSRQSDVIVIASSDFTNGKYASPVAGEMSPDEALSQLLEGSGLSYRMDAEGGVIVGPGTAKVPQSDILLAQAETGGSSTGRSREKIIVTGQKREEYIQDVPIAISAFTQEDLTISQIAGGPDLITQIPNFSFTKTNFTGYSIQIRGIGTQAISATTDPAVAVAMNNTPFIRNRFFEQEFYDLERVEVLRGPQGTLYGRNATAGVVNLLTAKPTFDKEMRLSADKGNYNSTRLEGMMNIPLVEDQVGLRLAGAWTRRDGYSTNEITGSPIDGRDLWSSRISLRFAPSDRVDATLIWEHFEEDDDRLRSGKQLCDKDIYGDGDVATGSWAGEQALLSQGCKRVSLYDTGDPNDPNDNGAFETPNGYRLPYYHPLGALFLPNVGGLDPYASNVQSQDLRVIESTVDPHYSARTDIGQFSIDFDITDDLTLTSETAYLADSIFSTQDFNRFNTTSGAWADTPQSLFDRNILNYNDAGNPEFCDPQIGCADRLVAVDLSTAETTQFSQEFRLTSAYSGPFNFSLGTNFLRYDTNEKYYVFINALSLFAAISPLSPIHQDPNAQYIPGVTTNAECLRNGAITPQADSIEAVAGCTYIDPNPIGALNDRGHNYFLSNNPFKLISYAAFGEAYWNLTDNLKLTAGLRYSVDKKEAPRIPSWTLAGETVGYPVAEVIEQEWREPTGRLVLDWKPDLSFTEETLIYGSYSRGYKAGGANPPSAGIVVYSETVDVRDKLDANSATRPRTFDPEYVDAFEIGAKNTLLDGDLTLNMAAFYYDYEGYQISRIVDRAAYNDNFDATVWGLEFEAEWWALENLRLSVKGGYQNTRIADGETSIDLMDRTAGDPDWRVVAPFPTFTQNCILPAGDDLPPNNSSGGGPGPCQVQYPAYAGPIAGYEIPGFDPNDPYINGGEGIAKELGGNELPNAPPYTATLSGDYILPMSPDWTLTFHGDAHYQSESWWRIFQDHEFARLNEYYTMNLAAILSSEDGWNVMGYIKNVTDETAITGAFLYSDDVGLPTNVFLTEPRLYGVRVTKDWTGGDFLGSMFNDGSERDPDKPYPFHLMIGGQVQRVDAPNETFGSGVASAFSDKLNGLDDQEQDLDWGDGREIKLTYAPNKRWSYSAGLRFGKTNNVSRHDDIELATGGEGRWCFFKYGPPNCAAEPRFWQYKDNYSVTDISEREEHTLIDFSIGRDVGVGGLSSSTISAGLRYAYFKSETNVNFYGIPNWAVYEGGTYKSDYGNFDRHHARLDADRKFSGLGPVLAWEASKRLLGDDDLGRLDLDWSLSGGVLFGKQKAVLDGETVSGYYYDDNLYGGALGDLDPVCPGTQLPGCPATVTPYDGMRENDVNVPTLGASLGVSYRVDRFRIGAGYRWERYYDAIDGGLTEQEKFDRTLDGPYLNVSVGFGG